jgi:hypothetical protein
MQQNGFIRLREGCVVRHPGVNIPCIFVLILGLLFLPGIVGASEVEQVENGDFSDGLTGWETYVSGPGADTPVVVSGRAYFVTTTGGIGRISQTVYLTNVKYLNCSYQASFSAGGSGVVKIDDSNLGSISSGTGTESFDVSSYNGNCVVSFEINSGPGSTMYLDNISALRSMSSLYRPTASATVALMDEGSSDLIMSYLGLDQPYVDEDSTGMNLSALAGEVFGVYSDSGLGPFALLIVFCMPFVGLWIMQRDMIIPGGIGILFSGFVLVRLPADFQGVAVMMIAVCVTAVIYSIYVRR